MVRRSRRETKRWMQRALPCERAGGRSRRVRTEAVKRGAIHEGELVTLEKAAGEKEGRGDRSTANNGKEHCEKKKEKEAVEQGAGQMEVRGLHWY